MILFSLIFSLILFPTKSFYGKICFLTCPDADQLGDTGLYVRLSGEGQWVFIYLSLCIPVHSYFKIKYFVIMKYTLKIELELASGFMSSEEEFSQFQN